MKIDLHCHTKATKSGDSLKRNISSTEFKNKVNSVDVKIIGITNHNYFDYKQYQEFVDIVNDEFMIWPGVELDVKGIVNDRGHVLIVVNPNNVVDFNAKLSDLLGDKSCDEFECDIETLSCFANSLDCLIMPHYYKPKSLDEESINYLKNKLRESYRLLYEPSNYRSLGILINHNKNSIIGSDVKDWDKYHEIAFANLKIDVDSFEQFILLIKKDEALIETLLNKQFKANIDIAYNSSIKEKVDFYDDINIIFGSKGTGKSEILKKINSYFISKGKDIGYYIPQETEDKIDEKTEVKTEERKLDYYNKENYSDLISSIRTWTDCNVTQFKDYLEYEKSSNKNSNKIKMKILNIPTIVDLYKDKLNTDTNNYTNVENAINKLSSIKLIDYIDEEDILNLNILLAKLKTNIAISKNKNWENSNSIIYSNKSVNELKEIVERKTELKTKPSDTGFLIFAKNRLKIKQQLKKLIDTFNYRFDDVLLPIGKLEEGKELKLRRISKMLCNESKTAEFIIGINSLKEAKKSIFDSYDKVLSMDFNTYYSDMINNLTQNNIISMDSFLGVSKKFEINNEPYKPSSGEATMIILDDVLKAEHDVYLLDEPEKSLGNAYVNDVLVPRLNDLSKHKKTVIIVTHNANIAVRTFPFRSILKEYKNGIYKTYVGNPFSNKLINISDQTDTKEWKDESVKILEGGKEAFEERGEIYGK